MWRPRNDAGTVLPYSSGTADLRIATASSLSSPPATRLLARESPDSRSVLLGDHRGPLRPSSQVGGRRNRSESGSLSPQAATYAAAVTASRRSPVRGTPRLNPGRAGSTAAWRPRSNGRASARSRMSSSRRSGSSGWRADDPSCGRAAATRFSRRSPPAAYYGGVGGGCSEQPSSARRSLRA